MPSVRIDAYWTDLDASAQSIAGALALLGGSERERAGRFRFERDRRRFILRRGLLRTLLAHRLGCDPAALHFTQNAFGKPALHGGGLRFNTSHSHGLALIAFTRDAELGCDIERCDGRIDSGAISRTLFAPGEVAMLERLPPGEQPDGFFRCWTRKEAYVKAVGLGLSHRLDAFDTSPPDGRLAGWSVKSFEPAPLYHAAIAAQGEELDLILRPC